MADQNKTDAESEFYNEILSPCELFAARARSRKIPVRGQKDFYPNDSEEQTRRLQQSLDEHWSLISEERVERLGNLVKATWIPSDQIVELQSPAAKFWQTMGFSANNKQYLLPEEALYLMECGNLQVFHLDLPLSIQDGYESFLSSDTVSLQQYQVFGHLKRLGYVVHRFDPRIFQESKGLQDSESAEASSYEKQLNLAWSRDRAARQLKRKRSASPTPTCSRTETQEESTTEKMEVDDCSRKDEGDEKCAETPEAQTVNSADEGGGRTWWMTDVSGPLSDRSLAHVSASGSSRWDFGAIPFPDLGSRERSRRSLAPPDPSLLPADLSVGVCNPASWLQKINLRKIDMSAKERRREEDKRRRRWDVNKDKEVRRCRNWAEYEELLARRRAKRQGRPAHLWNREVTPLHDPTQPTSTAELQDKIRLIKSTDLLEGASRLKASEEWRICFNVYQPDSVADFKKSKPGKPYSRMCVCSFDGPVPDLAAIKQLAFQSRDVPVVFAVVDHGDISFYTFKGFQLPTDVYP